MPEESAPVFAKRRDRGISRFVLPVLLAVIAFAVYWPSLSSGFIYDSAIEIKEGFFTSLANLPAVLTLKVLHMRLLLGDRPGQLLYLMLIAGVCGTKPLGYHLGSNLLHAANVGLLVVLLRRLVPPKDRGSEVRWTLALSAVVLIFAVHPLAGETVAMVGYSSDLLATFFTLLVLLAATAFDPDHPRRAWLAGTAGTLCAFAAVTCKESGAAACVLLVVYWFLYRRAEPLKPWLGFLGAAIALTFAFLAARFLLALPTTNPDMLGYPGGSFVYLFVAQPRLWVFMMGKIIWPTGLSGDYRIDDLGGLSSTFAIIVLLVVLAGQAWLATRSRLGAMGVAIYWLGLATVSNFIPLYRPIGDRFYYLPMAGVAAQLLVLLVMAAKSREGFWAALAACYLFVTTFTVLTVARQPIFANDLTFWSDTVEASPSSWTAHFNRAGLLYQTGQADASIAEYRKTLAIDPHNVDARVNLAEVYAHEGRTDEEIDQLRQGLAMDPTVAEAHNNLGNALLTKGQMDEALVHFQKAVELDPHYAEAWNGLGIAEARKGRMDDAILHFQRAAQLKPDYANAHANIGAALAQKGRMDEAIVEFQAALKLDPADAAAQKDLEQAEAMKTKAVRGK